MLVCVMNTIYHHHLQVSMEMFIYNNKSIWRNGFLMHLGLFYDEKLNSLSICPIEQNYKELIVYKCIIEFFFIFTFDQIHQARK